MGKTYTLEDGEGLMAELKSTRGKMTQGQDPGLEYIAPLGPYLKKVEF